VENKKVLLEKIDLVVVVDVQESYSKIIHNGIINPQHNSPKYDIIIK